MYAKQIYGSAALLGIVLFANLVWLAPFNGNAPSVGLINQAQIPAAPTSPTAAVPSVGGASKLMAFVPQLSPFTGPFLKEHHQGKFNCNGCDLELYS